MRNLFFTHPLVAFSLRIGVKAPDYIESIGEFYAEGNGNLFGEDGIVIDIKGLLYLPINDVREVFLRIFFDKIVPWLANREKL